MFSYIWPLALVVTSNVFYHICTKSMPEAINPFAALAVTYLVGAVVSVVIYFVLNKDTDIMREIHALNWVPFVLGVVIVGLEAGFVYAYKAGWQVSILSIVQAAILTVALIGVGFALYSERLTWNKGVGIAVCFLGLLLINIK